MIYKYLVKIDLYLIIFWLSTIFAISCSTIEPKMTANSCIMFEEKRYWYKDSKKSYDKWGVPISIQLAIINQESSFNQFAKPKRKKIIGIIPWKRPSSAFGYAQVVDPTWEWYKTKTGNSNASRANFHDITDFIGWYVTQSYKIIGIPKNDAYNQYLAYHEGQKGFQNKTYEKKEWLKKAANNVKETSKMYNSQLKKCEKKLNEKGLFGFL